MNPKRPGVYIFDDDTTLPTGVHPFYGNSETKKRHNVYDKHGRWIGDDLRSNELPHRVVTSGARAALKGAEILDLFRRYELGDYDMGEAGFAVYGLPYDNPTGGQAHAWIIDDAVRTPEGEPPARNPFLSPGPQTLLLPSEY